MAVKFSEFTQETVASNVTGIVGYISSSETNIRIAPADLSTSYDLTATDNAANNVPLVLTGSDGSTDTVNLVGTGTVFLSSTGNVITIEGGVGVSTFTNANGTYVSATTVNTNATGDVTIGTIDLSAVDGTSDSTTRFLSKDNTWDLVDRGVTGSGTANIVPLWTDTTVLGDSAIAQSGTNIGIGTTTPSAPLTVQTNSSGVSIRALGRSADGYSFLTFRNSTDSATLGEIGISNAQNMQFYTAGTERMRIDSSGNVGVGTTTPGVKLEVIGSETSGIRLKSSALSSNGFNIYNNSSSDTAVLSNFYAGPMVFETNNTERMRIASTGQIKFNAYTSASAFTSTAVANLAVDSSGNIITEAAASTRTKQAHTISDATTGALTLSTTPSPNTTSYVDLYISGVYQVASSYTLSGTTLTLAGGTFFPQGAAVETITLS